MWTKEQQDKRFNDVVRNHYDDAVDAMDNELREELYFDLIPRSRSEFLAAYAAAHEARFGEVFAPLSGEAW